MKAVLYVISILWIVYGTLLVIYTERTREFLKKLFFIENVRLLGVVPLIFGTILSIGAFFHREMFWLVFILGVLGVMKGVYFFLDSNDHIKGLLEWWFNRADEKTIRFFGLITFLLGSAILSYLK